MKIRRMPLMINGAERFVFCDHEKDTLAEVLRRAGLTGTKIGCNEGECGACTVIFNGDPVASCGVLAAEVDGGEVMTIEGLSGEELHPLQQAFLDVGAVQCGFCTPGMIMSAQALLEAKAKPTEDEIKDAVAGNLCRCTGYVKIIDAIKSVAGGR